MPVSFTWPAGNGGVLGYFRDRESGDFAVYHAKELLRMLAAIPEVEDIDINPDDAALRLSSYLTKHQRVGNAEGGDFADGELAALRKERLAHFIRVEGATGGESHSNFRNTPAVLSDIVLALRTRTFPGGTLRPLEEDRNTIWHLQPDYPLGRLPVLKAKTPR